VAWKSTRTVGLATTFVLAATLAFAAPAGSSAPPPAKWRITCSSISGINNPGEKLTLSGCTGPTSGSGTTAAPFFTPSVIHWKSGATTTVSFDGSVQINKTATCPAQVTLRRGRVIKTTIKDIPLGFWADLCLRGNHIGLIRGTKMVF
jgi:hypothetical protein